MNHERMNLDQDLFKMGKSSLCSERKGKLRKHAWRWMASAATVGQEMDPVELSFILGELLCSVSYCLAGCCG